MIRLLNFLGLCFIFFLISCQAEWDIVPSSYEPEVIANFKLSLTAVDFSVHALSQAEIDSDGTLHAVYPKTTGYGLTYLTGKPGAYTFVDSLTDRTNHGEHIALDHLGNAYIMYESYYRDQIEIITNRTGTWETFTFPGTEWPASIKVDLNLKIHFLHFRLPEEEMWYTTDKSGSWVTEQLPVLHQTGGGEMVLDSMGNVHITYLENQEPVYTLAYMTNKSGSWERTIFTTENNTRFGLSIAVASDDSIRICFVNDFHIKLASNATGEWLIRTVHGPGWDYARIALDSNDNAYLVGRNFNIFYYLCSFKDKWYIKEIDDNYTANNSSILILPENAPIVLYVRQTDELIRADLEEVTFFEEYTLQYVGRLPN